jgi:putative spermidine/putrescine transport system permease protein
MRSGNLVTVGLVALPAAFFTAFFLVPLIVVFIASTPSGDGSLSFAQSRILFDSYHWSILAVTFRLGLYTTLICLVLAYPLAWYLVRVVRWRKWRRICVILIILPLFISNIVRSFGWMILLGRRGLVKDWLIGLVYVLLPFIVLTVGKALAKVDPSYEQASADLAAAFHLLGT